MAVSPWASHVRAVSPDQAFVAELLDGMEICMGGPTLGTLRISGTDLPIERCSPSLVWSDDSKLLAVPQWTSERMQRLLIVTIASHGFTYAPGEFDVLELHSFEEGVVRGIDSPIHKPKPVEFRLSDFIAR